MGRVVPEWETLGAHWRVYESWQKKGLRGLLEWERNVKAVTHLLSCSTVGQTLWKSQVLLKEKKVIPPSQQCYLATRSFKKEFRSKFFFHYFRLFSANVGFLWHFLDTVLQDAIYPGDLGKDYALKPGSCCALWCCLQMQLCFSNAVDEPNAAISTEKVWPFHMHSSHLKALLRQPRSPRSAAKSSWVVLFLLPLSQGEREHSCKPDSSAHIHIRTLALLLVPELGKPNCTIFYFYFFVTITIQVWM